MILDSLSEMRSLDPSDMLGAAKAMPEHIEKALVVSSSVPVGAPKSGHRNVVVGGLGGSAIAGDILRTLMEERAAVPCSVVREYVSPKFAGPETLFFCSSYSGNTEETLSLYEQAKRQRAGLVCLGSGGELEKRALLDGVPFLKMEEGLAPRAALGYSLFMILDVLRRLSVLPAEPGEVEQTVALLRRKALVYAEDVPSRENPAKQLALSLHGKQILTYGTRLTQCAALRWKCQFNENSKVPAFTNAFPELNHNEIVGWRKKDPSGAPFMAAVLRDGSEHSRVARRISVTLELMRADGVAAVEAWSEGESLVTRIFSLIYVGDFASIYLAFLNGEDPTPVQRIQELKRRLSEEQGS
ncbi:MAG: bifunctional phosphoglucose/phosphomannose isomerase [Candidatus Eisenbacteria bacterium]|nr:bifunctional phosphoglucose/phosphomannose isomerase [Candidatus Eisenbacteria bacterium]